MEDRHFSTSFLTFKKIMANLDLMADTLTPGTLGTGRSL